MVRFGLLLGLVLGLVLGFGLVCTPLDKNIVDSFFWSYPFLFSALLLYLAARELTESQGPKKGHKETWKVQTDRLQ